MNNTSVDSYLQHGCGRCDRFQTPECVVHLWTEPLIALRELLQKTELVEDMKWGSPCYTLNGKNVVMLASRKESCMLTFLKGAALTDEDGLLEKPGPNTKLPRLVNFRSLDDVIEVLPQVKKLIEQAIEVERSGVKVVSEEHSDTLPQELADRLASDPDLSRAFEALTPGRQRSYCIYISGAKQSATRIGRVERSIPKIFTGKGYNER